MVEGVVAKRLQPRAKPNRGDSALARILQRAEDDFIWIRDRIAIAGNPELEARRVQHRRDVVDDGREFLEPLPDMGVVEVAGYIAEDVGGEKHIVGSEAPPRFGQEAGDRGKPIFHVDWLRKLQPWRVGKAHIVE